MIIIHKKGMTALNFIRHLCIIVLPSIYEELWSGVALIINNLDWLSPFFYYIYMFCFCFFFYFSSWWMGKGMKSWFWSEFGLLSRWWHLQYEKSSDSEYWTVGDGEGGDPCFLTVQSSQSASTSWSCYHFC